MILRLKLSFPCSLTLWGSGEFCSFLRCMEQWYNSSHARRKWLQYCQIHNFSGHNVFLAYFPVRRDFYYYHWSLCTYNLTSEWVSQALRGYCFILPRGQWSFPSTRGTRHPPLIRAGFEHVTIRLRRHDANLSASWPDSTPWQYEMCPTFCTLARKYVIDKIHNPSSNQGNISTCITVGWANISFEHLRVENTFGGSNIWRVLQVFPTNAVNFFQRPFLSSFLAFNKRNQKLPPIDELYFVRLWSNWVGRP